MLKKSNIEKVLEMIYKFPTTKRTIREMARKTSLAPPTALEFVRLLKKEGFIRKSRVARASQISANLESQYYKRRKRAYNLISIYESGLLDHLIKTYNDPSAIILFGSYSRGEDVEKSDIDLAILTSQHKRLNLHQFEKKLARKVSIHEIEFDRISEELRNNLYNGIVLHGAL